MPGDSCRRRRRGVRAGRAASRAAWPDVRFAIGVHPHQAHKFADDPGGRRRLTAQPARRVRRARARSARSVSTTTTTSRRATCSRRCSARSCGWRATAACRSSFTRAKPKTTPCASSTRNRRAGCAACSTVFPATRRAAARALATGFHVSIPGIVDVSQGAATCARRRSEIPEDRLLIETDSPYLAPVPFRGKRNEPAYVVKVLEAGVAARHRARRPGLRGWSRTSTNSSARDLVTNRRDEPSSRTSVKKFRP